MVQSAVGCSVHKVRQHPERTAATWRWHGRKACSLRRQAHLPGLASACRASDPAGSVQGLMPALGRLLASGRELSALLEALEDIVVLGGAELLRGEAGALAAALAATLRSVHSAICAPQPVTASSPAGMPKVYLRPVDSSRGCTAVCTQVVCCRDRPRLGSEQCNCLEGAVVVGMCAAWLSAFVCARPQASSTSETQKAISDRLHKLQSKQSTLVVEGDLVRAGAPVAALGHEETADALSGASLAGVLLRVAPQWAPGLLEPYLRGVCALLAAPESAAQQRNARFVALVEARALAILPSKPGVMHCLACCTKLRRSVCCWPCRRRSCSSKVRCD